jgi:hypothetical protein
VEALLLRSETSQHMELSLPASPVYGDTHNPQVFFLEVQSDRWSTEQFGLCEQSTVFRLEVPRVITLTAALLSVSPLVSFNSWRIFALN